MILRAYGVRTAAVLGLCVAFSLGCSEPAAEPVEDDEEQAPRDGGGRAASDRANRDGGRADGATAAKDAGKDAKSDAGKDAASPRADAGGQGDGTSADAGTAPGLSGLRAVLLVGNSVSGTDSFCLRPNAKSAQCLMSRLSAIRN